MDAYDCQITIFKKDTEDIKNVILKNKRLFNIKNLPSPNGIWDGTIHKFFFRIDDKILNLHTYNIWYFQDHKTLAPQNIQLILKVLNDINKILKKYEIQIILNDENE